MRTIKLASLRLDKGIPVMQALKDRRSERSLSELLWAANGRNREDNGRTAPSAMNRHPVDVYVALQGGTYMYDQLNINLHQLLAETSEN
ncbi:MAG: hypothetical protein ACP5IM_06970 [Candidatus Bathyarchaeia archaeon]